MTTITAVQLRKDMDKYIKLASKGSYVRVTYRNKDVAVLGPVISSKKSNAKAFFEAADEFSSSLEGKLKDLSDEELVELKNKHIVDKYGR